MIPPAGSPPDRSAVGVLVLCGVPIGDVRDASRRLGETLAAADIIAAEDTRRLRRLASSLGIDVHAEVVSYFDANETERAARLLERLRAGATVALVTDAGMPGVSDPGYRLVRAAADAGIPVTVVPGPSSVTAALAVSGLPTDRWAFEGFLPRKAGERRTRLAELSNERRTLVFLESPHRVATSLVDLEAAFGDREAVLCRELTKTYEEVVRRTLRGLAVWAGEREVRGEVTLVVAGAGDTSSSAAPVDLATAVADLEQDGTPRKEAMALVARSAGVSRRVVYEAVLGAKGR
ncbi:MAG TPA: 16S rRNA (cytidine(1402)-2'-O)-methyltransferase [Frankiaceae bacterium]|nr:16S rRNA (cytidine(1402)-2'-O)-methyltransferase [Frankiaceae bacterium]